MKVVLDTNVLVSGIFFSGPPAEILKAWREGDVQIALSPEIIDEYIKVARTLTEKFPDIETDPILTLIVANSNIVQTPPLPYPACEDPDDNKFLAGALASESKIIISGDKHLLKLPVYQGITILTPRAFTDQYLRKNDNREPYTNTRFLLVLHPLGNPNPLDAIISRSISEAPASSVLPTHRR